MDVFAVERRDEGAVEAVHHLVRHLVRFLLEALQRLDVRRTAVRRGFEQIAQKLSRFLVAIGDLGEEVEELFITRQQTHAVPWK